MPSASAPTAASSTTAALARASDGTASGPLCLALGGMLAAADRSVLLLDVDADIQPLARYTPGAIDSDLSQVLLGDATLEEATYPIQVAGDHIAVSPFRAPFARLARAKASEAAQQLSPILEAAATRYDHVIVHTPPIGSNPAVAAVTEASTVGIATRADEYGLDALYTMQGRIEDIGAEWTTTLATGRNKHADAVDVVLPDIVPGMSAPADPSSISKQTRTALATLASQLCGVEIPVTRP